VITRRIVEAVERVGAVTGLTLDGADARQPRSELAERAAVPGVGRRDRFTLHETTRAGQPASYARPGFPVPRLPGRLRVSRRSPCAAPLRLFFKVTVAVTSPVVGARWSIGEGPAGGAMTPGHFAPDG
jgi:hypothetical protein